MRTEKTLLMGGQILNSEMNAELVSMQKMIMKAAKEQLRIKSEREEAIFRQAVVEALVAGDFRSYIRPDGELIDVVYAPYAGIQQAREENAYLRRQLAEAEQEKARILHDFATMLMALVPKEILDKAIDEALITPPQEATDE